MADAVRTVTSQRCPRCSAPVVGDYKFCPACAYRLRSTVAEPAAPIAPRAGAWKTGFLVALVAAGLLAGALGYVVLLNPRWMRREPTTPQFVGLPTTTILKVDDIPSLLVELPSGPAAWYPNTDPREGEPEYIQAYVPYVMRAMRYETTQGMYAEFIRDIQENPDRVPAWWLTSKPGPDPLLHVPLAWRVYDRDDPERVVAWQNDPEQANLPVTQITFYDAYGFAEWIKAHFARRGKPMNFQLPTLFEWQRAARGGNLAYDWPWGAEKFFYACNSRAFWGEGNKGALHPVMWWYHEPPGTGGATSEGLFGMAGNARELAFHHGVKKEYDPLSGTPSVVWELDPTARWAWACGGSYKAGIDDCTADSSILVNFDEAYDDVGFRLVVRPD